MQIFWGAFEAEQPGTQTAYAWQTAEEAANPSCKDCPLAFVLKTRDVFVVYDEDGCEIGADTTWEAAQARAAKAIAEAATAWE